ncbi:MAG: hypothetical protein RBT71_14380 [Flavobacteriales bacterium]|jgi:hypothetical protein|nr:hypothetical protein [Flavobacteriales bacterium]
MKKAIKRKAGELLGYGFTHQQAFDQIMLEHPEAKPARVAGHLRQRPSLMAREHHRGLHRALMLLVLLSAAVRVWRAAEGRPLGWDLPTAYLALVPIATLLVGHALYRWQGPVFQWVGWANVFGIMPLVQSVAATGARGPGWGLLPSALSVAIGLICLYLYHRAFPTMKEVPDPLGGPKRFVFTPEGGL